MDINEFVVGSIFYTEGGGMWKCTDIGSRTISAIKIDEDEGVDSAWYQGPPYSVKEFTFVERDLMFCYVDDLGRLKNNLLKKFSDKPSFSIEAKEKITEMYVNFKLPHFDFYIFCTVRVGPNGEIYQPVSPNINQEEFKDMSAEQQAYVKHNYSINIYELFTEQFYVMPVKKFLTLKAATEDDYRKRKEDMNMNRLI